MLTSGQWQNSPFTISLKPNCLTVSVSDPREASVFSYDCAGRLWTAYIDGILYRRGLDGKVMAKWRLPGDRRERRWLTSQEADSIEARCCTTLTALAMAIQSGAATLTSPLPEHGIAMVQRAAAFDTRESHGDAHRYTEIYKPVGILPPDQYMAVVLQATEGCSFNTCTFCSFYRDRPFRIKPIDEFTAHAQAVKEFLGDGMSLRRTIFLADANALVTPMRLLVPLMEAAHSVFDVDSLGGIYAFLDGFSGEKKTVDDYRVLADHGLQCVYVGLESGNAELLKFLNKPGTPADTIRAVQSIKQAGISVGVIILLGAGGHGYAYRHVRDTIKALDSMPLGEGDIVYFSQLVVSDSLPYAQQALDHQLHPLTVDEQSQQREEIEQGLQFSRRRGLPRISPYDIREFVY